MSGESVCTCVHVYVSVSTYARMCKRCAVWAHLQTEINVRVSVNSLSGGQTDPIILRPIKIKNIYGFFSTRLSAYCRHGVLCKPVTTHIGSF